MNSDNTRIASAKDAAILEAFEARAGAYTAYLALPMESEATPDEFVGKVGAEENRLMADVDAAEKLIQSTRATTARGAECQLWCALSHFVGNREPDARSYVADFRYFEQREDELDWPARLVFTAIKSLRSIGGAS